MSKVDPTEQTNRKQADLHTTPGPWTARAKASGGSWWVMAAPPKPGHRGFLAECVARGSENEANARLISAAPDLLAALKSLMAAYKSVLPGIRYIAVQDYALVNDAPVAATRAILKAEGK